MSSETGNAFFKYTGFSFSINFFQNEDKSIFKIVYRKCARILQMYNGSIKYTGLSIKSFKMDLSSFLEKFYKIHKFMHILFRRSEGI
jgi:hypothetical protein